MIFVQWKLCITCCGVIEAFIFFSVYYSFRVNVRRAIDDPEKKNFSPLAVLIAPITWPLLILLNILVLTLSSLAFGIFLVLFPFALLLFRKPFLIKWILNQAEKIGNELLKINTALLRATGLYHPPLKPLSF